MKEPAKILHFPDEPFNGIKLQFARERAGFARSKLADLVATSPSFITACEKLRKRPSTDLQLLLAEALDVHPCFFQGTILGDWKLASCHFRHRQCATATEKFSLRSHLYVYSLLLNVLASIVRFPVARFPEVASNDPRSAEAIASIVRGHWRITETNPIGHICRLIENAGIVVLLHSSDSNRVDACSHFGQHPLILLAKNKRNASRLTFDLAHEVGELVYRRYGATDVQHEREINHFAGALLMPLEGFGVHFSIKPLSLSHLLELKKTWGVSFSAILQRALGLRIISEHTFVLWKRKIAARGWSKNEPGEQGFNGPEILKSAMDIVKRKAISLHDLAAHVGLTTKALNAMLKENGIGMPIVERDAAISANRVSPILKMSGDEDAEFASPNWFS